MAESVNKVAEASPYSSHVLKVYFDDDKKLVKLYVHRALVEKHPKLLSAIIASSPPGKTQVALPQASPRGASTPEVGHVLVNWLYTGTYRVEASPQESLKIALGVYALARQYDLPGLKALARGQADCLGSFVDIYTTIDAVLDVFPQKSSEHDEWLDEFVSSRTNAALQDDSTSAAVSAESAEHDEGTFIAKTIVKRVLDAYREKAEDLAAREAALEEREWVLSEKQKAFNNTFDDTAMEFVKANALTAREAALEEREPALAEQQMSSDNAVDDFAKAAAPEPDHDLAPEEVPSAFPMAVVEELLALASPAPASEDDWVMTSPREAVPEPEELVLRRKTCQRCNNPCNGRKCRTSRSCKRARLAEKAAQELESKGVFEEHETKGEPEPEPEPVQQ